MSKVKLIGVVLLVAVSAVLLRSRIGGEDDSTDE